MSANADVIYRAIQRMRAAGLRFNADGAEIALQKLEATNDYLRLALWTCLVQAGGDTDGNEKPHMDDESLIQSAVDAVKSMREAYDEAI